MEDTETGNDPIGRSHGTWRSSASGRDENTITRNGFRRTIVTVLFHVKQVQAPWINVQVSAGECRSAMLGDPMSPDEVHQLRW